MDAALHNALLAKRQIESQIRELNERLRKIEAFISLYDEFAQGVTSSASAVSSSPNVGGDKKLSVPEAVAAILSDGYPRQTHILLNMLESQGIKIGGAKPHINLSSTLSRDSRFISKGPKVGWTLTSKMASPATAATGTGLFSNSAVTGTTQKREH